MEEFSAQTSPSELQSSSSQKPKFPKLVLYFALFILLISWIAFWLNFFGVIKLSKFFPLLPQTPTVGKFEQKTVDVLALPRWGAFGDTVVRLPDGSLQITTSPGATETKVPNLFDFIEVGPEGFEILVKAKTIPKGERDYYVTGETVLFNKEDGELVDAYIGIDGEGYLTAYLVSSIDKKKTKTEIISQSQRIKPTSGAVRIKVINSGREEYWNFYDGETNEALATNINSPVMFLYNTSQNKISFGFYPQAISAEGAIMTVNHFKLINKK